MTRIFFPGVANLFLAPDHGGRSNMTNKVFNPCGQRTQYRIDQGCSVRRKEHSTKILGLWVKILKEPCQPVPCVIFYRAFGGFFAVHFFLIQRSSIKKQKIGKSKLGRSHVAQKD